MSTTEVHGTVAEGFEQVREEFAAVVAEEDGQSGAQLAAYLRGRLVVDLWAGAEVTDTTLTGLHSSSKGAAGLVIAMLVQDGVLDVDQTVAHYWPRFATAGKEHITVRDVLTHRAGIIGVAGGFTVAELADERVIAERLIGQRPYFAPRTAHGYGGFVMYAILGEVVRAITGSTVQQLFEQRIRAPYGLDVYLGLPEELDHRYLPILPWQATPEMEAAFAANSPNPHGLAGISYNLNARGFTAADVMALPNDPQLRRLGQASAGGVGSARGLARMYAAAVCGVDGRPPLLTLDTIETISEIHSSGADLVRGQAPYTLGFEAKGLMHPFLGVHAFGHAGSAGSDGFADPHIGLTYGYTRRRAAFAFNAPENARLAAAIHRAATASGYAHAA
ncbi:beta-lactamase family protein [Nocardia cyriacigeorgica]|uniref:Beta-lactamase family protein n=1 Tax=Nocardia cyriacigeorgica TaxID=135487 RepID=A0A6P1CVZ4_9NOCA|nr:serine hydrolase domain-containing protein [Nocardia cyriacigeorgica]MBF6424554.1 beta-lactamase family protein [Nocardia cyriacigeorgica]NEW36691.1 beta-lactamase family protein [Nocardia cyriacigeorgica]BDT88941.1 serine hydrolase [Nocardia cyriacigeorgica]BDU08356.1 serine hydrolase [Nocardia cyriacigeorgica]